MPQEEKMQHFHIPTFLPPSSPFSSLKVTTSPLPTLPTSPQTTQLLVRITHAALNHVDLLYARGLHQNNKKLVTPPFTLGSEFAGVVVAVVGPGAGDRNGTSEQSNSNVAGPAGGANGGKSRTMVRGIRKGGAVHAQPQHSYDSLHDAEGVFKAGPGGNSEEIEDDATKYGGDFGDDDTNASSFNVGDRVYGAALGAFSTHIMVEASRVRRVLDGWSLRDAAGLPATLPVAYGALVKSAGVRKGETVLVHAGSGGIGVMLVQVARAPGCKVKATVGSESKRQVLCRELGMGREDVVLYSERGWEEKVKQGTEDEEGVDVVIDVVGLVKESIRCCRYGGRIVVVGFVGRGGKMEDLQVNRVLLKGMTLLGYRYGETNRRISGSDEAIWQACEDLMRRNFIKPVTYHERFTGLEAVPKAMEAMAARKVYGKAIVDIASEEEASTGRPKL